MSGPPGAGPGPDVVPVREGLFSLAGPRLLGSRCDRCGSPGFPRRPTCAYCSSEELTDVALSDTGVLWAFTAVTAAPPGYRGEVPYGFGVVELPEGIRVVTRLTEPDPSRLSLGQPVHLVLDDLGPDDAGRRVVTFAFAPGDAP